MYRLVDFLYEYYFCHFSATFPRLRSRCNKKPAKKRKEVTKKTAPTMNWSHIHGNGAIKIPKSVSRINLIPAAIMIAGITRMINANIRAMKKPPNNSINFTMGIKKVKQAPIFPEKTKIVCDNFSAERYLHIILNVHFLG